MRSGSIRQRGRKRIPGSETAECVEPFSCCMAYSYGNLFVVRTNDMRLRSIQRRKECGSERVGCAEAMESGSSL